MRIIVCLDDRDGMLFAGKRQSADRKLRQRVLEMTAGSRLWMNSYSAKQFTEEAESILVSEGFLDEAAAGEYCFVENADLAPYADKIEGVIVYRWNRAYPAEVKFPRALFAGRWKLVGSSEFPGHSHETITEESYIL